jgi:cell division protein FtsI (penicillin-binding protein 3)
MMERVVTAVGTGPLARVPGYRVAGKTGTVRKHISQTERNGRAGAYSTTDYYSLFAGFAPVSAPRVVAVVVVDDANNGKFYGGDVAAPVFAEVMSGALRLLAVPPDDAESLVTAPQPPSVPGGRVAQAAAVGTL